MSSHRATEQPPTAFWPKALGIILGVFTFWIAFVAFLLIVLTHEGRGFTLSAAWLAGIPVVAALASLQAYCLVDLANPERRVKGRNKGQWAVAILCSVTLGCIAYLTAGREGY
jgi:hypothetical protein